MSLTETISDALLDQVYKLQQRRTREIEENGQTYSLGTQQIKAIRDGSTLYFNQGAPVKAGSLLSNVDLIGHLVVMHTEEEAGRIAAQVEHLQALASVFQAVTTGVDMQGRAHYKLIETNWTSIPCSAPIGSKIKLPAAYRPDCGELLLIKGTYFKVMSATLAGPLVEIAVEPW